MGDVVALLGTLELENFEHRSFVPFNRLASVLTRERVFELLQQRDLKFYLIKESLDRVLNGGLRTFAILATIQDIGSITYFLEADQFSQVSFDARLPLGEADVSRYFSNPDKGRLFLRRQWTFLAPVIREDQSRRKLDSRTILPFLNKHLIGEGGFARVYKVRVDGSHHNLSNTQIEIDLVCKELARPDKSRTLAEEFNHEISILSALRCLQHPNIITLITAFSKDSIHSFLFPVADCDLKSLLNTCSRLPGFQTETELLGSLWGLSSALQAVHDYFLPELNIQQIGCHYDIKPSNILVNRGKLLLSDFGLSRLRGADDGSRTTFKAGEGSYIAPECESISENFKHGMIGRASDVWSFGCVLAEILAFFKVEPANGPAAVQQFYEERKLKVRSFVSYPFHGENGPHPAVERFLKHCKVDSTLSHGMKSLARIVERILRYDPAQRPTARDVTGRLFHLTQQTRVAVIASTFNGDLAQLDLELELQMERLTIWSEVAGLNADLLDVPESNWFASKHSVTDYQHLEQLLTHIETETEMIATELERTSPGHPAFRLCYRLQQLQDELWEHQPPEVRRYMYSQLEERMLSKDSLLLSQTAAELAQDSPVGKAFGGGYSSPNERLYRRYVYLVTMRRVAAAMVGQHRQTQDLRLDRESVRGPQHDLGPHTVATLETTGKLVLVEYINYEEWNSHVEELLERVNSIASLRSRDVSESIFPVLKCHGYYHDPAQYELGLVYALPLETQNTIPISFLTALQRTEARTLQPSLTQRYNLASALVAHVLSFHRGGWLHKSISALNIICFPDAFSSIAASLAAPYFIGFNRSRINDNSSFSALDGIERAYQHPVYLSKTEVYVDDARNAMVRFRQEFDYYSVGMVLIEIAIWRPLSSLANKPNQSPEELQAKLLSKVVPLVRTYMGDLYAAAVHFCLTAYEEQQQSLEKTRDAFNANVVLPISRCLV